MVKIAAICGQILGSQLFWIGTYFDEPKLEQDKVEDEGKEEEDAKRKSLLCVLVRL